MTLFSYALMPHGVTGRNLYWVGGSSTWDTTPGTKWALTSGGAGGQAIPTVNDNVFIDAGSGVVTVTISGTAGTPSVCRSLTCTGFTGTLAQAISKVLTIGDSVGGSLTLVAGMTYAPNGGSTINFVSTKTGNTVTTASKTMGNVTFNGTGGGWTLGGNFTSNSASTITLTKGALNDGGHAIIFNKFSSSNSNIRALTMTGTWTSIHLPDPDFWDITIPTNMTLTATSSSIVTDLGTATTSVFHGGGLSYGSVTLDVGGGTNSGTCTIEAANTFVNLLLTASTSSGFLPRMSLSANQVVSNTFTISGVSASSRLLVQSDTLGTQRTITAATVSASNADFQDIVGAGAGSWNLAAITGKSGDCGGNSGITFTPATTVYWFKDSGSFTDATKWFLATNGGGGGGRAPLPQDTAIFDANSFSTTTRVVTMNMSRMGTLNWTGATNTPQMTIASNSDIRVYGDFTIISAMNISASADLRFQGYGNNNITTNGKSWPTTNVILNCNVGTYTQQDNFTSTGDIFIFSGNWVTNSKTVSCNDYNISGGVFTATGTLTLSATLIVSGGTLDATGNTITGATTAAISGGTLNAGTLVLSSTYTQTAGGTVSIGSGGVSCTTANISSSSTRTLNMGSGTWTLTSTGTVWNAGTTTGLTFNAQTATIDITNTSVTTKTFTGGGKTYYNLRVRGAASAATVTISGSNTFNNTTFDPLSNIRLTAATTQIVQGTCTATGTLGNTIVVNSTSTTNAIISSASNVSWAFCTLTHLTGTGGGTFAATSSTDGGGNVNWTITP